MENADPTKNPANPKERYGDKKRRVDLVPSALELGAAVALAEGAQKYGPFNWRVNHVKAMTYVGAIKRHLACFTDGEDKDPESLTGKLHLEGIAACVAILLDSYYAGILVDDRPHAGCAPSLCRLPPEPPQAATETTTATMRADMEAIATRPMLGQQLSLFPKHLWRGEVENMSHCDDPGCSECPMPLPAARRGA